ncbi:MAG: 3-isopropylmalate dehydratase small subunit [Gemmatimonadaceae bacterium]
MPRFTVVESTAVVLHTDDVDTDQIIPARFLKTTDRAGLGLHCFADWRYDAAGQPVRDFPLNAPHAAAARILVVGRNFGCGSSREHAPWALADFGFRVVVAPSFADIFRGNALKNALLPVALPAADHATLLAALIRTPSQLINVDLRSCQLALQDGSSWSFDLPPFARRCLLDGVDQLGYLVSVGPEICAYERAHPAIISTTT